MRLNKLTGSRHRLVVWSSLTRGILRAYTTRKEKAGISISPPMIKTRLIRWSAFAGQGLGG